MNRLLLVLSLALIVLPGCGKATSSTTSAPTGAISGKIIVPGDSSGSGKPGNIIPKDARLKKMPKPAKDDGTITVNGVKQSKLDPQADFVPGEVIVKYKPGKASYKTGTTAISVNYKSEGISKKDDIQALNAAVLRTKAFGDFHGGKINIRKAKEETIKFIEQLRNDPLVEYAEPNYRRYPMGRKEPRDPLYSEGKNGMWNYEKIHLPEAWKIISDTTNSLGQLEPDRIGDPSVIVAVLDNGFILTHDDLKDNLLIQDGYDFVLNPESSGDGNGRDDDPSFPVDGYNITHKKLRQYGDTSTAYKAMIDGGVSKEDATKILNSYWTSEVSHGTHVAGTISAQTNNGIGIPGVGWNVKIIPVRVLGMVGGADDDLIQGLLYAAGLSNASEKTPTQRADIINLSLGGYPMNSAGQDAITRARNAGVIIVAAAGNSAKTGNPISYPASYDGVISVGATDTKDDRASYSNYNDFVDICAPAGADEDAGNVPRTLSAVYNVDTGEDTYVELYGTSMATPHVAGVIALMQSIRVKKGLPKLTPDDVDALLPDIVDDLGPAGKDSEFGYGRINAVKAVCAAAGIPIPTPELAVYPDAIFIGRDESTATIDLINIGSGTITINNITKTAAWLALVTDNSSQRGAFASVQLTVDRTGLADGYAQDVITVNTSNGTKNIPVFLETQPPIDPGTITVYLRKEGTIVATATTSVATNFVYSFSNVETGVYTVEAGTDAGSNGISGDDWDEYRGVYPSSLTPQAITIESGTSFAGVDVPIQRLGNISYHPGNSFYPIQGIIIARVVNEATGLPIPGATVFIGNNLSNATADITGTAYIRGSFTGAQTVTATASGYSTQTYYQTNSSYLTFTLADLSPNADEVNVDVTVIGLDAGDSYVWIFLGEQPALVAYDGVNPPQNTFTGIPKNSPFVLSVAVYNVLNQSTKYAHLHYENGVDLNQSIPITAEAPSDWRNVGALLTIPTGGNFDSVTAQYLSMGYVFPNLGTYYFTGFKVFGANSVNLSLPKTDEEDNVSFIGGAWNTGDTNELTYAALHGSFDALPTTATFVLMDVAGLQSPGNGSVVSSTSPTLQWSMPTDADMGFLTISNDTTGFQWKIIFPSSVTTIALPSIPSGGLSGGMTYTWQVSSIAIPAFDFDDFDWRYVNQEFTKFSSSKKRTFSTP